MVLLPNVYEPPIACYLKSSFRTDMKFNLQLGAECTGVLQSAFVLIVLQ